MPHANARLNEYGRRLIVDRVHAGHRPADVAAHLGCSRATVYKWLRRFREEGPTGLADRSSRPRSCPHKTPARVERRILTTRARCRRGQDWLAAELNVSASTIGRVLRRNHVPLLCELDALTGTPIRRGPATRTRYERARPGELIHIDVKQLGRIPEGGGWRIHGRGERPAAKRGPGFDYVHSAVDDHTRIAYSEIHPDQQGATCAEFLLRAARFFQALGISRIERVMTDNALNYRKSHDFHHALATLDARHVLIRPHCPWQNGKVERFNRTLQAEWAYSRPFTSNLERSRQLRTWLHHYNHHRRHTALGGHPPITRLSTTR